MADIINEPNKILDQTAVRLEAISSNYVSISTNTNTITLSAAGVANPTSFIATPSLNGQLRGIEDLTWTVTPNTITYSVNATTKVLTIAAADAPANTVITATASLTFLGTAYTKSVNFNKIVNTPTAELTLTSIGVPADSSGNVLSFFGATTTMNVYVGSENDSTNWTYSVTKTNVTTSEATTSRTQTVTGLSANIGYIDFVASKTGFTNLTKRFTITKQTAGAQGAQGLQGIQGPKGDNGQDGQDGQDGLPGIKTFSGLVYYTGGTPTGNSSNAPSTNDLSGTYNFSNNTFSSLSANWSLSAPLFQAGNDYKYWYSRFTVVESSSGSNSGTASFSPASQTIGFSGLVTFSSATPTTLTTSSGNTFNYTAIDGGSITTGIIKSANYSYSSGNFSTAGTQFDLSSGLIRSKSFLIDGSGNATFAGTITSTALIGSTAASTVVTGAASGATSLQPGSAASDVNNNTTTISGNKIRTGIIESANYSYSSGNFSTAGTQFDLSSGLIRSKSFLIDGSGNATFAGTITSTALIGSTAASTVVTGAASGATSLQPGSAASDVNNNTTTISGNKIRTGIIESANYSYSSGNFSTAGTQFDLSSGLIRSKSFLIDGSGNATFAGTIEAGSFITKNVASISDKTRIEINASSSNRIKIYNTSNIETASFGGTGTDNNPTISLQVKNPQEGVTSSYTQAIDIQLPVYNNTNITTNKYLGATGIMVKTTANESTYGTMSAELGAWVSNAGLYPPYDIAGLKAQILNPNNNDGHLVRGKVASWQQTTFGAGNGGVGIFSSFYAQVRKSVDTNQDIIVHIGDYTNFHAINIINGTFKYGNVTIATPPNNTTQYLRADGTWQTISGSYTLPLAASGTRGGVQIGYTTTGKNYAVQLDASEKMYVNVPWTDTDTVYSLPLAANGTRGGVQIGFATDSNNRNYAVQLSGEKMYVNVPWTDTDTNTWNANTLNVAGYVAAPTNTTTNKVWKTDGSGNPAWRDDSDTIYSLPTATTTTLGGIKIGSRLSIDANGVLSAADQSISTSASVQFGSFGVGTAASGTTGEIRATNEITAYYSDRRLKENVSVISNALDKIKKLNGITYTPNDLAATFGYNKSTNLVGLFADEVKQVLPQAVKPAPFDIDSAGNSISGENYETIQYEKLIPLLVEAIKEQQKQIDQLKRLLEA